MSESTVIEPYGAIIVQSIPNFGISVWASCSRTANPLASINGNECTALQLLTLAWFLNFILYTKYEMYSCTNTGVLIVQWFKGVLHPWALFLKTLCIFSKNNANLDKVSYGSGQKCSKELKNHSFTSVETIVVKLQWKMCKNQYFPCFEP